MAFAAWPSPSSEQTALADPANWPNDPLYAQSWWLFGFTPESIAAHLPPDQAAQGLGSAFDAQWRRTRGSADKVIALVGTGVQWGEPDLTGAWALSQGELPFPEDEAAAAHGTHDLNGDGVFDVRDFTSAAPGEALAPATARDPRLASRPDRGDVNGNGVIDPGDLIALFSDGVDGDGNGLVDDIAGWDFLDGDNDPSDPLASSPGLHAALRAAARANNGIGGVGGCPECRVLPLRVAASGALEPSRVRQALSVARADVVALLGCVTDPQTSLEQQARALAATGRTIVSPSCPRQLLPPFAGHLIVAAVGPNHSDLAQATSFLERRCGQDARSFDLLVPAETCADDAVPLAAAAVAMNGEAWVRATAQQQRLHLSDRPPLQLPLAELVEPRDRARLGRGAPIDVRVAVRGTLRPTTQLRLFVATGAAPSNGAFSERALTADGADLVATIADVDAEQVVIRLVTTDTEDASLHDLREVAVFEHTSRVLAPGFPRWIESGAAVAPRLVDLDRDDLDEWVVATRDGKVHALKPDGTELTGFPIAASETIVAQPAVADLDDNGTRELIVSTLEGRLMVFRSDGSKTIDVAIEGGMRAAPVVAPSAYGPVLVAAGQSGLLHLFGSDGTPLEGSPLALPLSRVVNAPAAADLDGDGFPELAVTGQAPDGRPMAVLVRVVRNSAAVAPGWPVELAPAGTALPPVAGDFDGNGSVELALGAAGAPLRVFGPTGEVTCELSWIDAPAGVTQLAPAVAKLGSLGRLSLAAAFGDALGVWSVGAQLVTNRTEADAPAPLRSGFPTTEVVEDGTGLAVADVDGDASPDFVGSSQGALRVIASTGQPLEAFSEPAFDAFVEGPSVGIPGDRLVITAATRDGWLYAWNALGEPDELQWDGPLHDPEHTSFAGTPLPRRVLEGAIGIHAPPEVPPPGCCTGAPGPVDATGLALLLWLARLRTVGLPRRNRLG